MKDQKPLISFIIPVYNAELYLSKCLESLLQQTLSQIEIICVNDGSTDASLKILESYAHADSRLKVISQKNAGPATARNTGLAEASGEYLWFVDADDWIELNSVEQLSMYFDSTKPDIIGFIGDTYNNKTSKTTLDDFRNLSQIPSSFFHTSFDSTKGKDFLFVLPQEVWSRIFKTKFIRDINLKFDTTIWGLDDGIFLVEAFLKASSIYYSKDILYHYRTHNNGSVVYSLNRPRCKRFNLPTLYAKKCDQILSELNQNPSDFQGLIIRNLNRIIQTYPRLKREYKKLFYNEFKNYLATSNVGSLKFIKDSPVLSLIQNIENSSYEEFLLKNFFYQRLISFNRIKVFILGIPIYKKYIQHTSSESRVLFCLIKKCTLNKTQEKIIKCKYYFCGIPFYEVNKPLNLSQSI